MQYRLQGGLRDIGAGLLHFKRGVRDIVCTWGCWTAAIKGRAGCTGGGAIHKLKGACAISFTRGVLDCCNQIKGWVRDIVCAGGAGLLQSNQRVGARYRLRGGLLDHCNQIKGDARYRQRGGLLDCCNYRGCARDRREWNKSWQKNGIGLAPIAVACCCSTRFFYVPVGFRVPGLTLSSSSSSAGSAPPSQGSRGATPSPKAGDSLSLSLSFSPWESVGHQTASVMQTYAAVELSPLNESIHGTKPLQVPNNQT